MSRTTKTLVAMLVAVGLIAAACGDDDATSSTTAGATTVAPATTADTGTDVVRVALVLPCAINDLSWCQQAYVGAKALEDRGLIELAYVESVLEDAASSKRVFRGFAEDGYDLVIAHSFPYMDAVFEVAEEFPETDFVWTNSGLERTADNVAAYDERFYEAAYLIGILAAGVTETGTIGAIGGFDIPECHSMFAAFQMGADLVTGDGGTEQINTYTGDWYDAVLASEAVIAQADQGADVFLACGSAPARGSIAAAEDSDLAAVGFVGDMAPLSPEFVLASVVWDLEGLFEVIVNDVAAGTFRPTRIYKPGVKDGVVEVALNPDFGREIPAEVMEIFEQAQADIKSGAFEVPFVPSD